MVPLPGRSAPALTDTIEEAVARRYRVFLSTGAFASFMSQRDYERVNRPVVRDSVVGSDTIRMATDSTYSTYANRSTGVLDVLSPTVQANLTFHDLASGFPLLLSFGAALRTRGGAPFPNRSWDSQSG